MPTCQPGEIVQVSNSAEAIDRAVDQTVINAGRIVDHENRLLVNEAAISQNTQDIAALDPTSLEARIVVNEGDIAQNKNDITVLSNANLDARIGVNEVDIAQNVVDINNLSSDLAISNSDISTLQADLNTVETDVAALEAIDHTQFANISGDPTQEFQANNPVGLQDVVTLNYLTNYTLGDAVSLGGIPSAGYALVGGSNTEVFKVADDVSTDSAVSGQRMIDYTAKKNGDGLNVFQVADPLAPQDAIPKAFADLYYASASTTYSMSESDANFLPQTQYASETVPGAVRASTASEALAGIDTVAYMSSADVKAFCDANYVHI